MLATWLLAARNKPLPKSARRDRQRNASCFVLLLVVFFLFAPFNASAQLDVRKIQRQQLPNGLSLLLLEEHTFPSVSVQMLYRTGGRNEPQGQSGIAHFLEHMAFRATESFPDTDVVSRIYAAGGEWHGYTWIDQTTYFATVPSDQLNLLLRIEADRMQRLLIEPQWLEAEKGAVLAEMHGHENDPAAVLHDAVVFAAFQAHPYRNNVIGWESDILALRQQDVVDFYQRHYVPANAVLAVVGNFDQAAVIEQVEALFGDFPVLAATPLPHTTEPPQKGERRVELLGAGNSSYFEIAYPAPAANDPDFAAMLVLQQWLSGGTGVNFMQQYGNSPLQPGTALDGKFENLNTWYPPAAQSYLFSLQGSMAAEDDLQQAGQIIESVLQRVRTGQLDEAEIQRSRQRVLEELVFDLSSAEHTAHQLAYYHGLDALDQWLDLPEKVAQVSVADLQRIATRHLQPWQRTIGWYRAGELPQLEVEQQPKVGSGDDPATPSGAASGKAATHTTGFAAGPREAAAAGNQPLLQTATTGAALPQPYSLINQQGVPLLVQENPATASSFISLVINGRQWQGSSDLQTDQPVWGYSSLSAESLPGKTDETLGRLLEELAKLARDETASSESSDPSSRLQALMEEMLDLQSTSLAGQEQRPGISLVVLSGELPETQIQRAQARLAGVEAAAVSNLPTEQNSPAPQWPQQDRQLQLPYALAQAQLAFVVPAPLPGAEDYLAWRALQYILAHDYEGRLGKEAISNRGLAYYIDSQYRSDGRRAWIGLSTGVDPAKMADLEALFRQQVSGLQQQPPSAAEVTEARHHLLGRLATARQTNTELANGLAEHWLWFDALPDPQQQRQALADLQYQQVLDAIPGFVRGRYAVIAAGKAATNMTD